MNLLNKVVPNVKKYNDYLFEVKKKTSPMMISGLTDVGKVHMAYSTRFYSEKPICIITYNDMQARKLVKDLSFFGENVYFFPKREIISFDYLAESKDLLFDRINVLNAITQNRAKVVVTTIEAAMQKMISKKSLYQNSMKIKLGDTLELEDLKEKLVNLGFERYDLIEGKGQFSVRGGIVDIATNTKDGIRIEFWGDEVDSIRKFSISSQRTIDTLNEIDINPAYEFLLEDSLENIAERIEEKSYNKAISDRVEQDIEEIKNGDYLNKIDKYFSSFYEENNTLLDYLNDDYIIFLDEIEKIKARADNIARDNENLIEDLLTKKRIPPENLINEDDYYYFNNRLENKQIIYLEKQDIGFVDKQSMHAKRNGYSFSYREVNFFRSSMDVLFQELQKARKSNSITVILAGTRDTAKKFSDSLLEKQILCDYQDNLEDLDPLPGSIIVTQGALSSGFEMPEFELKVISVAEIFEVKKKRLRSNKTFQDAEKIVFADLKPGDYIVHKVNGIGEFLGVHNIKADGVTKDYIKLKYRNNDILYVPTDSLDNIRKYIGGSDLGVRLSKLGSKEWEKTKSNVKSHLREVAEELIKLYAKREQIRGYSFSHDTPWQQEFEYSFPYQETDDQLRCIDEVKKDMEKPKPMDRLLCGDVGYGKTEVAIRASFKAVMDQKQVVYLAPTTVLSQQQYEEYVERMKGYPIRIEILNRFKSPKEQKEIVKKLELGEVDILIGTHRVLSKDVKFKNLGLLIIDEEHRFGVKAKEQIKQYKTQVDVLTMTATPIPRTLHMSIVGMRDMSVIYEPPQNRKPVQTYVLEYDKEVVKEAITKELERQGQVFYIYNNVETIAKKVQELKELVPEATIEFAHGKMGGVELEEIMQNFVDKKINVLVCTTILESGIDIPNANTIIVENADRLGLAQLYQIRGRVGRSDRQAYAYITYKRDKLLSEQADSRLKAIKEFTEFGSGFKIAMRDLEIRGGGSLLGEIQHGHMEQVGYDMYCELLDEVVKELRGEEILDEVDVQIELNVSSYIPEEYIENSSLKIEVYQDIALCKNEEGIQNVIESIKDRFGEIPKEVENLLDITRIKILARDKFITKIVQRENNIVFYYDKDKFDFNIVDKLMKKFVNRIKFSPSNVNPYITYHLHNENDVLNEIKQFLNF